MSEYTKEFDDWWYKPLLDSVKCNGGVPDKDMMRYKDLGKQSAFLAWVARDQEITKLKKALELANKAIEFYADVTNNPKQYMRQGYLVYNLKKKIFVDGGEKAREAQKQIKEVMEGK